MREIIKKKVWGFFNVFIEIQNLHNSGAKPERVEIMKLDNQTDGEYLIIITL